jgi:hypothetical protein
VAREIVPVPFVLAGAGAGADSESETDARLRLRVDPKTDSVDSFGEGNVGTGESGARTASIEASEVNRDDDDMTAAAAPRP